MRSCWQSCAKVDGTLSVGLGERCQQCPGPLEVGSVESFGEPTIDRGQEIVGFGILALTLPQTAQAHGGTQLKGLRLLVTGNM